MRRYIIPLFFMFFSCEKVIQKPDPENDPVTNFNLLWETVDHKYSFFEFKNIDWDAVYEEYRPLVYQGMPDKELFEVLDAMLFTLRDGHVNLRSTFDLSRNWQWYLDSPENFNFSIIEREYLGDDYEITGPFQNTIIDSVGYIYYGSFSAGFSEKHLDYLMAKFSGLKGVIIDVRNNGGGAVANATGLANRFADKRRPAVLEYYKKGPGHDDFHDPVTTFVFPEGSSQFTGNVAVLSNRKSFSATTMFIQLMRVLPHVTIIGDTCGGGGGFPLSAELPNGWSYRFSSSIAAAPDGFNVEHGIPPDITVNLLPADETKGVDSILERALKEVGKR